MDRDQMIRDRLNKWASMTPKERGEVREKRLELLTESQRQWIDWARDFPKQYQKKPEPVYEPPKPSCYQCDHLYHYEDADCIGNVFDEAFYCEEPRLHKKLDFNKVHDPIECPKFLQREGWFTRRDSRPIPRDK